MILADREGWALFIGAPSDKNPFYEIVQQAKRRESGSFEARVRTQAIPSIQLEHAHRDESIGRRYVNSPCRPALDGELVIARRYVGVDARRRPCGEAVVRQKHVLHWVGWIDQRECVYAGPFPIDGWLAGDVPVVVERD